MSMDEQSGNLADETTEMMPESVAHQNEELRKRRSTRIMQAVPLAVTGVDALGRPFTERTSTLIINCHGCRYQSKHYVLKNMWVTLEVPHPETGQPPRTVRGRVAWIQRPRTVRQLFQVALELEQPGNTWGIAFPPPDWFSPSEGVRTSVYAGADESLPRVTDSSEIHLPLTETEPAPPAQQDNLRVFPAPVSATDASLQLARHMARLMADAKQQMHTAARDIAAQAVAAERRISMEEWEQKFSVAREQLTQQVTAAIAKIQDETDTRSRAAQSATAEALQRDLPQWIGPQLEELTKQLTQQISERGTAERAEQTQHLSSATESLRAICKDAEESAARLRAEAEKAEGLIADRAAESMREVDEVARQREVAANAHREAMGAAAKELQQQVTAALSASYSSWQNQLKVESDAAQAGFHSTIENTLISIQDKAASGLDEHVRGLLSLVKEETVRHTATVRETMNVTLAETEQRIAGLHISSQADTDQQAIAIREALNRATTEIEKRMADMRTSLDEQSKWLEGALARAVESSERLEHFSARIETTQGRALAGFESQIDDVLTLHRNELHRRSEALLEETNQRIRGTFDENCQAAISRFDQQIDAMVQPHISRTEEAIHRLAGGRSLLDAALTLQQDRIRTSADEAFAESLARFRENLGGVDQLLQEAAQAAASQNITEIEARITELKHRAVDDLMKSSEWYEKKAQTQIQSLTEKTVEQAENQFREKAGEVSSVFASELDHSSRSFIGHTQTQMEEVVRDAFENARALFAEASETTTAAFTDEIQRQARQELDGFGEEAQRSLGATRTQLDAARVELTQKVTSEQEAFLQKFKSAMHGAVETGVSDANARVRSGMSPLLDSWKSTVDAHASEMRNIYAQMSNQAAEQHRGRLENVSNQWMLATVASLDHQSREAVNVIAAKAAETLRETCAQVFAGVGETLRERLQQIASGLASSEQPMSKSQTAGGGDR